MSGALWPLLLVRSNGGSLRSVCYLWSYGTAPAWGTLHSAWPDNSSPGRHIHWCSPAYPYRQSPSSDRKSTRLNSSHVKISYAVFCLKKTTHEDRPCMKVHYSTATTGDLGRLSSSWAGASSAV